MTRPIIYRKDADPSADQLAAVSIYVPFATLPAAKKGRRPQS